MKGGWYLESKIYTVSDVLFQELEAQRVCVISAGGAMLSHYLDQRYIAV